MVSITCPYCARVGSLKVAPPVGTKVRCPGCSSRFDVPAADEPEGIVLDLGDDDHSTAGGSSQGHGDGPVDSPPASKSAPIPAPAVQVSTAPSGRSSPVGPATSTSPVPVPASPSNTSTRFAVHSAQARIAPPFSIKSFLMGLFAGLFFCIGLTVFARSINHPYRAEMLGHRFKQDNAYGATANAIEYLVEGDGTGHPEGWYIAGLICLLILSVDRLRRAVEDSNRPLT